MDSTTTRRLALPALALTGALALTACGGGGADTAAPGRSAPGGHGSGHGTGGDTAASNDADVAFLTGMKPHHEQAVQMSEIVLAADPPAEVAAIAEQIRAAQAPEIEQMDRMLADLEVDATAGHGGGHSGSHGGMMSAEDLAALEAASGADAARRYLVAMIAHHQGAIQASDVEIAEGRYRPAVELATSIKAAQQAEITQMQALLADL